MTGRHAFIAHMALLPSFAFLTLLFGIGGVWTGSEKLGGTAGIFGATAFFLLVACMAYIEGVPAPLPSRQVRRDLRDAKDRIRIDAEIRRMEREAGLR